MDLHEACSQFEQLAALAGVRVQVVGGKINPNGTITFKFKHLEYKWELVEPEEDDEQQVQ